MTDKLAAGLVNLASILGKCPHPDKKRYHTERMAKKWAGHRGLNYYKCICGLYHLTSYGIEPTCPICGAPIDEYTSCGCYEDLHYGE